jgi:hypothetical protein
VGIAAQGPRREWGSRGRWFESSHSDQKCWESTFICWSSALFIFKKFKIILLIAYLLQMALLRSQVRSVSPGGPFSWGHEKGPKNFSKILNLCLTKDIFMV